MRNNQRRSRARRKEYLAELEEKIRRYESSEDRYAANHTVQQLMHENDTLKRLLQSMGLGNEFLKSYISASGIALQMSKVATPSLQLDEKSCCGRTSCSSLSDEQVCSHSYLYVRFVLTFICSNRRRNPTEQLKQDYQILP
jgi:hypothetical protein